MNPGESLSNNSLENQEQKQERFYSDLLDISPEKIKDPTPVIFIPGWSNTPESLKSTLEAISAHGRRTISFAHTRKELVKEDLNIPSAEIQKVIALMEVINDLGLTKVDAVAFSEGAINTSIAAMLYPEKFRSILLASPAGMIGEDSFLKLTARFQTEGLVEAGRSLLDPKRRPAFLKHLVEQQKYIAKNLPLALKESAAIASSDIYPTLKKIREAGVKVGILTGTKDKLFPLQKIEDRTQIGVHFDSYKNMSGGHHEPMLDQEDYTDTIVQTLDGLAKARNDKHV